MNDSSERQIQDRFVALVRALGLHQPEGTPCGQPVSISEAHTLMELARGARLSQKELAARLRLEKSTISRLAANLERRAWLTRTPDTHDGRVMWLQLTAAGRQAAERLAATRADLFTRILSRIPDAERGAVLAALDLLVQAIDESNQRVEE